jgi:formylglycine-generating enzyme required for sulfatase activity
MKVCALILILVAPVIAQRHQDMSRIPGGTFDMGIDAADVSRLQQKYNVKRAELFEEEIPKHSVTLKTFYLDRTEVTNHAFKRFVDKHAGWRKDRTATALHNGTYLQHWTTGTFPEGQAKHPVVFVSWYAAAAFCRAAGKRLPTEAEWEFAARGGLSGREFPWGDEMPDKTRANFFGSEIGLPTAVGSYAANGYGLFDMAGNVWEFLADEWAKYPRVAFRGIGDKPAGDIPRQSQAGEPGRPRRIQMRG